MVAMAKYLVGSLLWEFTTKMEWALIERGNLCTQWINYSFVAWISARIGCKFYRDYIGNSQRSLLSPTGGVNRISPDTAIHEQMATQNYFTTSTTSWWPLWTMTRVARRTPTCATCRIEHTCTLSLVFLVWSLITLHMAQGRSRVYHPISIPSMMCGCLWVSPLHLLLLPAFLLSLPVLLLDVRLRLWLRDKQPARLRQRDLRHPGRFLSSCRIRRHRHGTVVLVRFFIHLGEKNQRTWDKLITLMKKVCCQLSPFSHVQVRRDPKTNSVRAKKRRSSRDSEKETIRMLLERQKRANSCWSQLWDPEARTSSRVW